MRYVIRRDDGQFVTRPGSHRSYTTDLDLARTFRSREEAERELCPGNERVEDVWELFARIL